MQTETIKLDPKGAQRLYRKYKEHQAYSTPIDREIQRSYQLLAQGKIIIRAIESIKVAGLDEEGLPKLAIAPATAKSCHLRRNNTGSMIMCPHRDFWHARKNQLRFGEETFTFPAASFRMRTWGAPGNRESQSEHEAVLPIIPTHLRPKRGLENYHVLWEAEWKRVPPRDPYLLRRIGKADLWLVVAAWDLTEVERAALATRM